MNILHHRSLNFHKKPVVRSLQGHYYYYYHSPRSQHILEHAQRVVPGLQALDARLVPVRPEHAARRDPHATKGADVELGLADWVCLVA